jgi:hypothetical protein
MKQLKTMAGVLCVFLALQACKKTVIEGPAGKDGASGTNGANGSNGINGTNGVTTYNFTVTEVDTTNEYEDPTIVSQGSSNNSSYFRTTRTDFIVPNLTQEVIDNGSVIVTVKRIIPVGFVATDGLKDSTSWYSLPINAQVTDGTYVYPNSYHYSFRKGILTLRVKIRNNQLKPKYFIPIHLKVTTIN